MLSWSRDFFSVSLKTNIQYMTRNRCTWDANRYLPCKSFAIHKARSLKERLSKSRGRLFQSTSSDNKLPHVTCCSISFTWILMRALWQLHGVGNITSHTLQMRTLGHKEIKNLPKVTKLVREGAGLGGHAFSFQGPWSLNHYPTLPDSCPTSRRIRAVRNSSDGSKSCFRGVLGQILKAQNHSIRFINLVNKHLEFLVTGRSKL